MKETLSKTVEFCETYIGNGVEEDYKHENEKLKSAHGVSGKIADIGAKNKSL